MDIYCLECGSERITGGSCADCGSDDTAEHDVGDYDSVSDDVLDGAVQHDEEWAAEDDKGQGSFGELESDALPF